MSDTFSSRLRRALGQLVIALVNATLILVVVALFLGLRLAGTAERVTETAVTAAAAQVAELRPLRDEVSGLRAQVAGLRDDLQSLRADAGATIDDKTAAALARLEAVDARLTAVSASLGPAVDAVAADPGIIVDRAVATGVEELGRWLAPLWGCTLPERT